MKTVLIKGKNYSVQKYGNGYWVCPEGVGVMPGFADTLEEAVADADRDTLKEQERLNVEAPWVLKKGDNDND